MSSRVGLSLAATLLPYDTALTLVSPVHVTTALAARSNQLF